MPLSLIILVGLFMLQSRGTARIGRLFGPVMLLWFLVLGVLGAWQIVKNPAVLAAINPVYGFDLITDRGWGIFWAFGSIVLAVTGAEALYADMGHFGRKPIRFAWLFLVHAGPAAQLLRPGRHDHERPDRGRRRCSSSWCRRTWCWAWSCSRPSPPSSPRRR